METSPGQSYTINGIKVQFPCKAYPSQLSMMDKILKGLDRSQNCLLESPTGSGKSLALLCSVLAWQATEHEKARIESEQEEDEGKKGGGYCCQCNTIETLNTSLPWSPRFTSTNETPPKPLLPFAAKGDVDNSFTDADVVIIDDDDDFKVSHRKFRTPGGRLMQNAVGQQQSHSPNADPAFWKMEVVSPPPGGTTSCCVCSCNKEKKSSQRKAAEDDTRYTECQKIYFGTRTHKQIAQITRELSKTAYRNVRMCVLASREHTCIDPQVSSMSNKNEECKNKLDNYGCRFQDRVRRVISHRNLESSGLDTAWDLEDFVSFCKSSKIKEGVKPAEHMALKNVVSGFNELVERYQQSLGSGDYDHAAKVWTGVDMVAQLDHLGIGPSQFDQLKKCLLIVTAAEDVEKGRNGGGSKGLHSSTKRVLEGLFLVLDFIYRDNLKYMHDYRIAMVRSMSYQQTQRASDGQWLSSRRRKGRFEATWTYTLHFWCLNPAVAFSDIGVATRCIVVTSGTLSPMTSFQSELGVPFDIQLEAGHVVGQSQVWVGAIARGPNGHQLLGNYHTSEQLTYQDDVGHLVRDVCATIPHGVLCFFPSYKSLEKICNRWKTTDLWSCLAAHKVIMTEPRTGDQLNFDELMRNFYDAISDTNDAEGGVNGVLLFAVCRGKVSEGIDFTDNNARAVITIGIPYPNIKNTQIQLKKDYNNAQASSRGLLPGSDWYEIQAFRALNQALGRCIRHRNDWGALILVDERFVKNPNKYVKGLSKWVRTKMKFFDAFRSAQTSLAQFTKERQEAAGSNPNISILGSQNLGAVSTMDLSINTPQKSTLRTPVAMDTNTHLSGAATPVQPLLDRVNGVMDASPVLPPTRGVGIRMQGFMLSSQAGGFLASQASSQVGPLPNTAHPLVSDNKPRTVSVLKPVVPDTAAKVAAPVVINSNSDGLRTEVCPTMTRVESSMTRVESSMTRVESSMTCVESSMTRAESPDLFDSEDLSCHPPNTSQVMADINNVLEEITGNGRSNIQATPGGAVVKTENAKPQSMSSLLSQIMKNKTRNGIAEIGVKEQCQVRVSSCHQSVDTCHQPSDTANDTKCDPVQCRKPLFKQFTETSDSGDVGRVDTVTHNDTVTADHKQKVCSSTRQTSRLNTRRTSSDSAAQHNHSMLGKIQPFSEEPHHMEAVVKCEPAGGTSAVDTSTVSDGTPLKRNVRNKRRRNWGNSCRKKGCGVEFIDEHIEGSNETDNHAIKCRTCDSKLFSTGQGGDMQHMALPSFLSDVATGLPPSAKALVLSDTTRVLPYTATLSSQCDGVTLNGHWSAADGCCVQYLYCETCYGGGNQHHLVGAQVRAVTSTTNPSIRIGQVWLIPSLVLLIQDLTSGDS